MAYIILFKEEYFNKDYVMRPYLYTVKVEGFEDLRRPVTGYDIFDRSRYGVKYFNTKKAAINQLNKINKDKEKFDEMVRNYPKVPEGIGKNAIKTLRFASKDHTYGPYNAKVVELPEIILLETNSRLSIDIQVSKILFELWNKS